MRYFDLATLSMTPSSGISETKIPLWWADGVSAKGSAPQENSGTLVFIEDGSINTTTTASGLVSSNNLFTLSSTWPTNLNYALEVSLTQNNTGFTGYASLHTNGSRVGATASVNGATSTTVLRTAKFTLTPGTSYGIALWTDGSSTSNYVTITDASIIVFPQ